ncbi:dTDP-4-dehydrorhamnose 3,5-epimerase [Patiriisocius marinus]|uniref:dTDP-4-dehydrorhamnose 3,5-epimerase n=1 Tax=Patiriisocius marinus TaxID=1397112 RepID=UPI00232BBC22|nr:dTDP-4-dehydrorhamnose 3,5-epimerase [Patiriisocius marinus]
MKIEQTLLSGCFVITPKTFEDSRGVFSETFNSKTFEEVTGISQDFVQDNQSISRYGVVRGLHFQRGSLAQAKLVRVVKGRVQDIVVDVREGSETFGKSFSIELSAANGKQLYVPRGFAHGFSVLEDGSIFAYKCDNFYDKESESGIIFNDSDLNLDWRLPKNDMIISEKDLELPLFKNALL